MFFCVKYVCVKYENRRIHIDRVCLVFNIPNAICNVPTVKSVTLVYLVMS
jgi:hypothetical protein